MKPTSTISPRRRRRTVRRSARRRPSRHIALLQFSFSNASEAAAMESWVRQHGSDYLHGQIKAYPREVGTPAARLNYSGSERTFEKFRETFEAFGEPVYLGSDIAAACVVSNTSAILYGCFVAAFFEAAAYGVAEGARFDSLLAVVPSALRLAASTIEYSARQIAAGEFDGDQASIDTHANALATLVNAMADGRPQPPVARAALDYLERARADGRGSMEIAAIYQRIVDSL
jgi:3-hydroxyisobutyrate dehydrogenase-like beta-hydroxyacid dehydrogenase